jgi:hypothetical protein
MPETYYVHPQEVWDAKRCAKEANHTAKDGLGTPYPFKGYIGSSASVPAAYGRTRYNGGCVRGGEWYNGEEKPLPKVADGYEIIVVPTWGWRIRRIGSK